MNGMARWFSSAWLVGLALGVADAVLTATTGYRVPQSILFTTLALDLVLVLGATLVAALAAKILLPRSAPTLPVVLVTVHGALGLEWLLRVGLHRSELTQPIGLGLLGAYCGLALVLLLILRRAKPRAELSSIPLLISLIVFELVIAGLPFVLGNLPEANRILPMVALALTCGLAFLLHRPVTLRPLFAALVPIDCALLVFAVGYFSGDSRPALPTSADATAAPADDARPNVILISLDTLRDDVVGPDADGNSLTPSLDRLAAGGRRYPHATSPAAWTLPAHASLLTGRYPASHGVLLDNARLPESQVTLAERLRDRGYLTAALTGGGYVSARRGLDRGFDVFDDLAAYRFYFFHEPAVIRTLRKLPFPAVRHFFEIHGPFADAIDRTIAWLEDPPKQPFFLFLHTYEIHNYYRLYGWWREAFESRGLTPDRYEHLASIQSPVFARAEGQAAFDVYEELYHAGVALIDAEVGRLLDALEQSTAGSNTAVFITSDHGEGFDLERERIYHGGRLHDDVVRVPLIGSVPSTAPALLESPIASVVDLTPTILELTGSARAPTQGVSLVSEEADRPFRFGHEAYLWKKGHHLGKIPLYEPSEWIAYVRTATHKLISKPDGWEYYDLSSDPAEAINLLADGTEPDPKLKRLLEAFLQNQRAQAPDAELSETSATDAELLKELGYLGH